MPPLCRETQSLGQQMLNAPLGINGLIEQYSDGVHSLEQDKTAHSLSIILKKNFEHFFRKFYLFFRKIFSYKSIHIFQRSNRKHLKLVRPYLSRVTSSSNSTPRRFPSYLLLTLLLYFLFIFYLPRCTLCSFCFFPAFLAIFILLSSNNNKICAINLLSPYIKCY